MFERRRRSGRDGRTSTRNRAEGGRCYRWTCSASCCIADARRRRSTSASIATRRHRARRLIAASSRRPRSRQVTTTLLSKQFLQRAAMLALQALYYTYGNSVCLSVRLSVRSRSLFAIARPSSVACLSSVTLVRCALVRRFKFSAIFLRR